MLGPEASLRLLLPPWPALASLYTPRAEVTLKQSCLWSAEMRVALLGLNIRERALVAFARLLLSERPFPAVSFAGLVVQV